MCYRYCKVYSCGHKKWAAPQYCPFARNNELTGRKSMCDQGRTTETVADHDLCGQEACYLEDLKRNGWTCCRRGESGNRIGWKDALDHRRGDVEVSKLLLSFWQGNSPVILENENAQKDRHPHIQACPQLHPSHLSTETDTPCSSGVGEGSSSKQSESLKRGAEGLEEQTTKRPRIASTLPTHSFITVRSHFLSLQLDERLQFLSWLFEGALASCTPEFNEDVQSAACLDYHGEIGPTRHGPSKGKKGHGGKQLWRWSAEDDARLLSMIEDRQSWPEIEKCFPGRTESALRQRQSTLRKRRNRRGLDPARSTTNTTNTHVSMASSPRPDTPAIAASAIDSPAHTSQKQPPTSPQPPRYPRVEVVIPTRLPRSRSTSP
ncbi:hypothetical protein MferCBS49748_005390 [Microsporum ferrugineum]